MRRIVHANCFPPTHPRGDALLTDEDLVAADAAPGQAVISGEDGMDAELAHTTSVAMWSAAFDWFRLDTRDPSIVAGISAGDLAGAEAALTVLMPAARAVLAMAAALDAGAAPATLVSVIPDGDGRYARLETLAADAALATVRSRLGASVALERVVSTDPRNARLRDKYARVRDPDPLVRSAAHRRIARKGALAIVNTLARVRKRGRPGLLVLEYNPSREFARRYGALPHRRWRLVCWPAQSRDLVALARSADEAIMLETPDVEDQPPSGVERRLRQLAEHLNGVTLSVVGVDLWPIVREPLLALAERYGRYAAALAQPLARELERRDVGAVLVPFDAAPHARLIVRVAQSMRIPTFVINDGFKSDEIQREGMTADVALAWSRALREDYFSRRPDGAHVTGNPRAERLSPVTGQRREPPRVLVGGHTFSPVDLNCHRSHAERFLDEVLAGVAIAQPHVDAKVIVKLHPADTSSYYRDCLARRPDLDIVVCAHGDVVDMFDSCDVFVTTYSTSLIEAVAVGLPTVYYRISEQRIGRPFSGDEFLAERSAASPPALARLLVDRELLAARPPAGWVEHYLGPAQGAVARIVEAIDTQLAEPIDTQLAEPIEPRPATGPPAIGSSGTIDR